MFRFWSALLNGLLVDAARSSLLGFESVGLSLSLVRAVDAVLRHWGMETHAWTLLLKWSVAGMVRQTEPR